MRRANLWKEVHHKPSYTWSLKNAVKSYNDIIHFHLVETTVIFIKDILLRHRKPPDLQTYPVVVFSNRGRRMHFITAVQSICHTLQRSHCTGGPWQSSVFSAYSIHEDVPVLRTGYCYSLCQDHNNSSCKCKGVNTQLKMNLLVKIKKRPEIMIELHPENLLQQLCSFNSRDYHTYWQECAIDAHYLWTYTSWSAVRNKKQRKKNINNYG